MIEPGVCVSAKKEFLTGVHQPSDEYYIALYGEKANLSRKTRRYTSTGEVYGQGYEQGGQKLVGFQSGETDNTGWIGWTANPLWPNASITASGALIYNQTKGNLALCVLEFDEPKTSTVGPFELLFNKVGGVIVRMP